MAVKKAELHVHLEGTISPALAKTLAKRNKLSLPDNLISADGKSYLSRDFMHFLSVYDIVADLIKSPQDYYDVTFDYLRSNALEDTIYVEMMYSPDHAEKATGIPSIEHLNAIQQAIRDAEHQFAIVGRIIITAVRHFGEEAAIRVAEYAHKHPVACATGFGLGGDEVNFPPKLFRKAYEIAAASGLSCTVHAGEFAPASGMLEAIAHLPIKRIGHGVQAIHSPETMAILKERDIALEICPSSNVKFNLFNDLSVHPFPELLAAGIKVSINSDDPPFIPTTLAHEYARVQEVYNYSDETMQSITRTAIDCAFIDEETKKKLHAKIK
ncbi:MULTISPECIES: adenosine deaminase [Legionella]|uniref:Adenosine deaminase n=1 Tax=Legionella septentrionalis TaxID=2498109 RepID=A0A3S0VBF6_9GAMM|nr:MULTISPECIES: adenosine deaminase [Legionella]MCP0914595.1 adenosine deaminase [Legionella sp. 27cVA30]RUQ90051.1 adenosine deaminase [Legionella septentrionalis]RUQ96179.1 adenosine deaminase [Legionella septentrionalis]RUR09343.1 adenosine deaminase [Legionella septentrionalis]RUR14293.1 adenosine deaminase [Legionella septentrionalis]